MNITPQTEIYLCAGVPFDNTYEHVRLLESTQDKLNYFNQFVISHMSGCMYQRQTNAINYMADYDSIASANYLYFRNIADGKYYFAFITSIEFANQNKSSITFEIDAFQTWFDKSALRECHVEREHVNDDTFGKHIVPEGLDTGEYVSNGISDITTLTPVIVMGVSEVLDNVQGQRMLDNTYTGLTYYYADKILSSRITEKINQYAESGKGDAIVSLFMYPKELLGISPNVTGSGWIVDDQTTSITDFRIDNSFAPLNGYTPKNNKLYTYPYRVLTVYGSGSQAVEYRYEYFSSFNNMFTVFSTLGGSAPIVCVPNNYKGFNFALDEPAQMYPYPTCSWINDNYKNWFAQNQMGLNYQFYSSAAQGAVGIVTNALSFNYGGAVNSLMSVVDKGAQIMISNEQHKIIPDSARGTTASANAYFANGQHYLYAVAKCIRYDYAKRIDDFFSHYGYKVSDFKVPNVTGRKNWNFVKLVDCNINLTAPVEIVEKIKSVFLNGVTFWHTDDVKNYSLDNSIV